MAPGVDGCVRIDRQHEVAAFTPQLGGFNANEFALKKAILGDTRAGVARKRLCSHWVASATDVGASAADLPSALTEVLASSDRAQYWLGRRFAHVTEQKLSA